MSKVTFKMPLRQQAVTEIEEEEVEDPLCWVNSLTWRCRVRRAEQLGQGLLLLSAKAPRVPQAKHIDRITM